MKILVVLGLGLLVAIHGEKLWRDDLRCGPHYKLPNGQPAQCNPYNEKGYTGCSPYGWCGKTAAHRACKTCIDYKTWRDDLRCGPSYKLLNGKGAQCDPLNEKGYSCCSPHGWCGKTAAHCKCRGCTDYTQYWRNDYKCGPSNPLPNGAAAQCNPHDVYGYKCCSPYGWCGKTAAHCACRSCINYGLE